MATGRINQVSPNWQLTFKCSVKSKFVSKEKKKLINVWIWWKLNGRWLLPRLLNTWFKILKAMNSLIKSDCQKVQVIWKYSRVWDGMAPPLFWLACPLRFAYEMTQKLLGWKRQGQRTFSPLCVFHFHYWMHDSKLAMGTNILKIPGGIFKNVRLGNLLSY